MQKRANHILFTATLLLIGLVYGCANRVAPGGGPYDDDPPKLIKMTPEDGALNVSKQRITLTFDEYITLKDPQKKVIISPPQLQRPQIQALGKRVEIVLEDSLIPNTTYTLDFTDAVQDNNEGNALENFSVAFSTGDAIDTMAFAGMVLDARNLEPVQNVVVGIHPADSMPSAFRDTTFLRMSRTSDYARFVIRNIKHGSYHIYALQEADGNYRYDNPTEGIAFLDSVITTRSMPAVRNDTIWRDSITVDTIHTVHYTRYLPDDLVLLFSTPESARRFISKRERPEPYRLDLTFNELPDSAFTIRAVDSLPTPAGSWYVLDQDPKTKVVSAFITDSLALKHQRFAVSYHTLDSLNNITLKTDSITLKLPKPKAQTGKKEKKAPSAPTEQQADSLRTATNTPKSPFSVSVEHKGSGGTSDSILFQTTLPIDTASLGAIKLYNANDSILKPVAITDIRLLPGRTTAGMITAPLKYGSQYELHFDSLTFCDIYGHHQSEMMVDGFKVEERDQFSSLEITVHDVEGPIIAELLNLQDAPVLIAYSDSTTVRFDDLKPDKYALRIIIDRNKNRRWDPADFDSGTQPEQVYYAPKTFELMKNWEIKENFYPLRVPIQRQKPRELIKNKPEEKKKKDRNAERERERREQQQREQSVTSPFRF